MWPRICRYQVYTEWMMYSLNKAEEKQEEKTLLLHTLKCLLGLQMRLVKLHNRNPHHVCRFNKNIPFQSDFLTILPIG